MALNPSNSSNSEQLALKGLSMYFMWQCYQNLAYKGLLFLHRTKSKKLVSDFLYFVLATILLNLCPLSGIQVQHSNNYVMGICLLEVTLYCNTQIATCLADAKLILFKSFCMILCCALDTILLVLSVYTHINTCILYLYDILLLLLLFVVASCQAF